MQRRLVTVTVGLKLLPEFGKLELRIVPQHLEVLPNFYFNFNQLQSALAIAHSYEVNFMNPFYSSIYF